MSATSLADGAAAGSSSDSEHARSIHDDLQLKPYRRRVPAMTKSRSVDAAFMDKPQTHSTDVQRDVLQEEIQRALELHARILADDAHFEGMVVHFMHGCTRVTKHVHTSVCTRAVNHPPHWTV
jgi:hypothetical protein